MKLYRLFHAQIVISIINMVLIVGALSLIFSENINQLLNQVEQDVDALIMQWEKEELVLVRNTVELEYRELENDELRSLASLLQSEQFLSLLWKHQYLSVIPFLNDAATELDIAQLLYVNEQGEILAHSGKIARFGIDLAKVSGLAFKNKLVFALDGVLLRVKKYPVVNAFGDYLGSIVTLNPYENTLLELKKFVHNANIGLVFLYQGSVVTNYGFPAEYNNFGSAGIDRYKNFAIECSPMQGFYDNQMVLCIAKSIQLLLNLNSSVSQAFQSSKNTTIQNTVFLSLFIIAMVCMALLLFYKLFITPLNNIHLGFSQLGSNKALPHIKTSRILEISQLHHSLRQIYKLFDEHKQLSLKLEQDAAHDALTQLPNRRFFKEQCERALAEAQREHKKVSLLLIDLDKFKSVNDLLGHDSGDILLCQIAERLQKQIRSYDLLARWGGDEFVLLVPNLVAAHYDELIRKIKRAFDEPFVIKGSSNYMNVSIGMSSFPENGSSLTELLVAADIAMYRAKELPGTHALSFHDLDSDKIKRELIIEKELRQCISNNELQLYFQPIFQVSTKKVSHAEALLRWDNSVLGQVSPAEFIPVAERIGLIKDIGAWVRQTAFKQLEDWALNEQLKPVLTLNTSPIELNDKNYSRVFIDELAGYEIDPGQITIEITESAIINDFSLVSQLLHTLSEHRIAWALDDFGTGYTSLHYLSNLNPDYLKIDRSLIQDIEQSERVKSLFSAILLLAKTLNIQVISEGIETESQYAILQNEQCGYFQGYWGAKPVDSEQFIAFFAQHS